MNKKLLLVDFIVKNHPLDYKFDEGKTNVTVLMRKKEVIGGTSFPYSKQNDLLGSDYSLDGRTNEEVNKGIENKKP